MKNRRLLVITATILLFSAGIFCQLKSNPRFAKHIIMLQVLDYVPFMFGFGILLKIIEGYKLKYIVLMGILAMVILTLGMIFDAMVLT